MEKLADALVFAVSYINCRDEDGDETYLDEDVNALESLASIIREATPAEQDALAAAAKRALEGALEAGHPQDSKWVRDYSRWMQDMFVDGWCGKPGALTGTGTGNRPKNDQSNGYYDGPGDYQRA